MRKTASTLILAVLVAMVWFSPGLDAQTATGTISGTVSDESGAVVPNVTVTVTNKATGNARTLTANAEGLYSAPALPAGDYEVRAELQGFRTEVRSAQVLAGSSTTVNMVLSVGATQEVVNVEAATAAAQSFAFGQPTQRAGQTFLSNGPRAVQVGARFSF